MAPYEGLRTTSVLSAVFCTFRLYYVFYTAGEYSGPTPVERHAPFGRKRNCAGAELSWYHQPQHQGIRDADWRIANFEGKIQRRES